MAAMPPIVVELRLEPDLEERIREIVREEIERLVGHIVKGLTR